MSWSFANLAQVSALGPQYGANARALPWTGTKPRYVRITDIDAEGQLRKDELVEADVQEFGEFLLEEGDLLLARSGNTVGKAYRYTTKDGNCIFAGYLIRFRPNPKVIDSRFLFYFTQSSVYQNWVLSKKRTAGQPNINGAEYAQLTIPLPPLSEQRRIVEILDQADELRKKRGEADAIAARILPALFYKMFGDPATNPMRWPKKRIGDLCDVISGATPRTDVPEYWDGSILWATPKDLSELDDFILLETKRRITKAGQDSCSTAMLPEGAVMLSSRAPIGLVAIAGAPMCTNQGFKNLVCKESVDPWYVFAWLRLNTHHLDAIGRGATFKEISKALVEAIEIPVPNVEIQMTFASRLQLVRNACVESKKSHKKMESLFSVLLHRAFSGDLTAKWREAHMKELLAEMEQQAKLLNLPKEALLC